MKFYSWQLRYGVAVAMAANIAQARQLILDKRVDDYDIEIIKKGKPEITTAKPVAVTWFN